MASYHCWLEPLAQPRLQDPPTPNYTVARGTDELWIELGSQHAWHFEGLSIVATNITDPGHYDNGFTANDYWHFP
jgi:hypothetical protein